MDLIEIATFTFPNDADVLESLFQAEKIEYYLNNQAGAIIIPGTGAVLSVKESDVPKAVEIIKQAGFNNNLII